MSASYVSVFEEFCKGFSGFRRLGYGHAELDPIIYGSILDDRYHGLKEHFFGKRFWSLRER